MRGGAIGGEREHEGHAVAKRCHDVPSAATATTGTGTGTAIVSGGWWLPRLEQRAEAKQRTC